MFGTYQLGTNQYGTVQDEIPFGFGQAQADIKQTNRGYGQAQTDIKQVGSGSGQAHAYIFQKNVFGQATALIDSSVKNVYGQAQCYINWCWPILPFTFVEDGSQNTPLAASQVLKAGTNIRLTENNGNGSGNNFIFIKSSAEGELGTTFLTGPGTFIVDVRITQDATVFPGIKNSSGGAGCPVNGISWCAMHGHFGQAQAYIEATNRAHGQANADIKSTGRGFGQAQAQIWDRNATGQAQAVIWDRLPHAQAQCKIADYGDLLQGAAAARTSVTNTVTVHLNNPPREGNLLVGIYLKRNAGTPSPPSGWTKIGSNYTKTDANNGDGSAWYKIAGPSEPQDFTWSFVSGVAQRIWVGEFNGNFLPESNVTESGAGNNPQDAGPLTPSAVPRVIIIGAITANNVPWTTVAPWIEVDQGPVADELPAHVVAYQNVPNPSGSYTYTPTGNSGLYGSILIVFSPSTRSSSGQAQALIKNTKESGQAQALIKAVNRAYGQAQTLISAQKAHGQANALIDSDIIGNTGQAQCLIEKKPIRNGQAQCSVQRLFQGYGQAQCFITRKQIYGQAQCFIGKTTGYGQAQCLIHVNQNNSGQAQCFINRFQGYGQCAAAIGHGGSGQAQCTIARVIGKSGQAQCFVNRSSKTGQAQCFVVGTVNNCGQANALVLGPQGHGQCQAMIRNIIKSCGQAQALIGHLKVAQAQALISGDRYIVKFNSMQLPGYAQFESFDSEMEITPHYNNLQDFSLSEYTGLRNKVISLRFKLVEKVYYDSKNLMQQAATIVRSKPKGFTKLHIQTESSYYLVQTKSISQNTTVRNDRMPEYEVTFEAKPWKIGEQTYTISGTGLIDTDQVGRTLSNGSWTPARLRLTGTDITVSGYTETGDFAGFINVSGAVINLDINSDMYTATIGGVNKEEHMINKDYALYVGPGKTYFDINGASSCEISYEDRWVL